MTTYLSKQTLKEAIGRLGICSAQASLGDYLVFKRALQIARSTTIRSGVGDTVVTGIRSESFLSAHIDVGLWVPPQRVLDEVGEPTLVACMQKLVGQRGAHAREHDPSLATPYFVPFGARRDSSLGYRQAKWPSNGPADTVGRWQRRSGKPIVLIEDTSPMEYRFEPRSARELADFFIVKGAQDHFSGEKARLLDTAIWWLRFTDLEQRFGSEPQPDELTAALITDLDLTTTEISAFFHAEQQPDEVSPMEYFGAGKLDSEEES